MKVPMFVYHFVNQHLTHHRERVINTILGFSMKVPAEKRNSIQKVTLIRHGIYEPETSRFLMKNIKKGDVCVDVGAFYGYYSVLFDYCEAGFVYAIEPNPEMIPVIKDNLWFPQDHNHLVCNYAVSDKVGNGELYLCDEACANSLVSDWENEVDRKVVGSLEVDVEKLDNLVRGDVDILKIDAEGHDVEVLKGSKRILKGKPRIIIVESIDDDRTRKIKQILKDYDCEYMDKRNFVFTKKGVKFYI